MLCLEMYYIKNYSNLAKILVMKRFKMDPDQTEYYNLNRGMSLNLW